MKNKKIMAVFAVLVMALGCLTCIAATSDNDASATLDDQGTVTLDASKDFESNANELKKLGINDASKWIKEKSKTTLILDNVEYRTKAPYAITITGTCNTFNIIVKGDNLIACGNDKDRSEFVDAILVTDDITKTLISGTGTLSIFCNGTFTGNGGSALGVVNDLEISGCKLIAVGPTIDDTKNENGYYKSNGIFLKNGNLTITNGAKVLTKGGDVSAVGECWLDNIRRYTTSIGVCVSDFNGTHNLIMDNTVLYAFGGDVESQAQGFYTEKSQKIDVSSTGLYVSGKIDLNKATLRGYGGDATGTKSTSTSTYKYVSSQGLMFNGNITAKESEIFMVGGRAVSSELAISAGMRHYNIVGEGTAKNITISLDYSDIYAFGNSYTGVDGERVSGSVGLFASEIGENAKNFSLAIYLKESVANFVGYENAKNSIGIRIVANTDGSATGSELKGTITVDDSDFYAFGNTVAICASKVQANGGDPGCIASKEYYDAGTTVTPGELTNLEQKYKTCALCYHYNLYVLSYDSIYSPIMSYAVDNEKAKLPAYEISFTPDGKKFKCWMIDGKEMRPGEVIDMTHGPVFAVAVWEDDNGTGSGDNNIWLWVALIVVVIIVLALIIIIALRHSSDKKAKAKPAAKKAAKPKAKKKTTRKVAAESEEETSVSKPKTRKVSKPKDRKAATKKAPVKKASKPKTTVRKTKTKRTSKR